MLSGLMIIVLVDWFMDKWEQRPWRAAMLWTLAMIIVLVGVVVGGRPGTIEVEGRLTRTI